MLLHLLLCFSATDVPANVHGFVLLCWHDQAMVFLPCSM
jgi:hypothetical protein